MRIILYNSSSFGGCFDYGRELYRAFQHQPSVTSVEWWIPENAAEDETKGIRKLFFSDQPEGLKRIFRQIHFLWRVLMNPFRLLLRLAAAPPSVVILNDFEQLTAPLWVPVFRIILADKHRFGVILHDPDRDAYPPALWWTRYSMKKLISLCDRAFYHAYLPVKDYYRDCGGCIFTDLPHGVFYFPPPDAAFSQKIRNSNPDGLTILSIPGNIRPEKNYHIAIGALPMLPDCMLLIAGAASNARVDVQSYYKLAEELGVSRRVIWLNGYLSREELSSVIAESDIILLNYADSFTSQSGIFNLTIPFRKPVITSSGKSGMTQVLEKFGLGIRVQEPGAASLAQAVQKSRESTDNEKRWEEYQNYASWENTVKVIAEGFSAI